MARVLSTPFEIVPKRQVASIVLYRVSSMLPCKFLEQSRFSSDQVRSVCLSGGVCDIEGNKKTGRVSARSRSEREGQDSKWNGNKEKTEIQLQLLRREKHGDKVIQI